MRRAPVHGGPSSGKPYLAARRRSPARLRSRNRAPPPTRAIPASSMGPELAPVNGSWPPPAVVLVAAPTAAPVVVGASVLEGATVAPVVVGASVGGAVVGAVEPLDS